ncbi:MutS-related protein [Enterococcus hulanensis]|uniref:MutS-related protein n=1 Tax=Enterococcus hulanensis TaxID=2559929 RepID=UPI004068992F
MLGQLFNTCLAKSYSFKPCHVYSSMNLKDDIVTGDSFYMAEIKSLKRLLHIAESSEYAMIFMDEMFKGTNMIERIAAASIILEKFSALDCFICLATHDVELSQILGERYENYHFREVVTADDILFDYALREGVTTGSNAIKLLAYCQYDPQIVSQAEAYAEKFRETGEWTNL